MSFTQLTSTMPVFVIGKGKGNAFAVIDYGPEHNLIWVTAIDETGEIWCAPNPMVRVRENWSLGRGKPPAEANAAALDPAERRAAVGWHDVAAAEERREPPHLRAVDIPDADAGHSAFP